MTEEDDRRIERLKDEIVSADSSHALDLIQKKLEILQNFKDDE